MWLIGIHRTPFGLLHMGSSRKTLTVPANVLWNWEDGSIRNILRFEWFLFVMKHWYFIGARVFYCIFMLARGVFIWLFVLMFVLYLAASYLVLIRSWQICNNVSVNIGPLLNCSHRKNLRIICKLRTGNFYRLWQTTDVYVNIPSSIESAL